jgi:hypothetical protein
MVSYDHLCRTIRTMEVLFDDPDGKDCSATADRLDAILSQARNDTDRAIGRLDDFTLRVTKLQTAESLIDRPLVFALNSTISYSYRDVEAILDRVQTGIWDVLGDKDADLSITAHKRGHLVLDKTIRSHATDDDVRSDAWLKKERVVSADELVGQLRARIEQDIFMVCQNTASLAAQLADKLPNLRVVERGSGLCVSSGSSSTTTTTSRESIKSSSSTSSLASGSFTSECCPEKACGPVAANVTTPTITVSVDDDVLDSASPNATVRVKPVPREMASLESIFEPTAAVAPTLVTRPSISTLESIFEPMAAVAPTLATRPSIATLESIFEPMAVASITTTTPGPDLASTENIFEPPAPAVVALHHRDSTNSLLRPELRAPPSMESIMDQVKEPDHAPMFFSLVEMVDTPPASLMSMLLAPPPPPSVRRLSFVSEDRNSLLSVLEDDESVAHLGIYDPTHSRTPSTPSLLSFESGSSPRDSVVATPSIGLPDTLPNDPLPKTVDEDADENDQMMIERYVGPEEHKAAAKALTLHMEHAVEHVSQVQVVDDDRDALSWAVGNRIDPFVFSLDVELFKRPIIIDSYGVVHAETGVEFEPKIPLLGPRLIDLEEWERQAELMQIKNETETTEHDEVATIADEETDEEPEATTEDDVIEPIVVKEPIEVPIPVEQHFASTSGPLLAPIPSRMRALIPISRPSTSNSAASVATTSLLFLAAASAASSRSHTPALRHKPSLGGLMMGVCQGSATLGLGGRRMTGVGLSLFARPAAGVNNMRRGRL